MEIILLRLDRIGDFALGVPAFRALRKAYPNDRLSVVVPSAVAELAGACPYFDEVYVFDALWLLPGWKPLERWRSAWKLIQFLRPKKADMVLDFRYQSRLDPLVTGLSGAKERVGYDLGWVSRFLTQKVSQPPSELHQVDRNLHLLQAMGVIGADRKLEVWFDEHDKKAALAHLPAQELLPGVPRIAIHIGAATPSKRWREESFEVLIHELHAMTQADILLLGSDKDLDFAHDVVDGLECPVINLVGKLTLRQMAALLAHCRVFIGCDSGATHIAAATGIPVVSLFSAANEVEVWKPLGAKVKVLTHHPTCSPCRSYECKRDDGYFCMAEIKVEDVVEEVKAFL
ncbi:MAG TPA: glycosyltransferase family 9 protein [bacterium]|nr:glycosyltransferase family 9 protein [bacterium]